MNLLSDIITYIRRILKTPSNESISDSLIIDYINRFWIMDVDARLQLFDLKKQYKFQTTPGVDQYNMPLYDLQTPLNESTMTINYYPVYQGFLGPAYVNGIEVAFSTQKEYFFSRWPNIVQNSYTIGVGDGTAGPYPLQIPFLTGVTPPNPPLNGIIRGHVDMQGVIAAAVSSGLNQDPPLAPLLNPTLNRSIPSTSINPNVFITSIDSTGANVVVQDSGQFLTDNVNCGLLMQPGNAPFGYSALPNGYSTTLNTINYLTGQVTLYFPTNIPLGNNINAQVLFFQSGLPREILFYNNCLTLRSPPAQSYLVELTAYMSPAAFLNLNDAIPFAYMAEYIARGAARKILSDTGDEEQLSFYEPLFREQETLVHIRSQRQFTATRTQTIYSQGLNYGNMMGNNVGNL